MVKNILLITAVLFGSDFLYSQNNANPKITSTIEKNIPQSNNSSDSVFVQVNERSSVKLSNSEYSEYLKNKNIELILSRRKNETDTQNEGGDNGKRKSASKN